MDLASGFFATVDGRRLPRFRLLIDVTYELTVQNRSGGRNRLASDASASLPWGGVKQLYR